MILNRFIENIYFIYLGPSVIAIWWVFVTSYFRRMHYRTIKTSYWTSSRSLRTRSHPSRWNPRFYHSIHSYRIPITLMSTKGFYGLNLLIVAVSRVILRWRISFLGVGRIGSWICLRRRRLCRLTCLGSCWCRTRWDRPLSWLFTKKRLFFVRRVYSFCPLRPWRLWSWTCPSNRPSNQWLLQVVFPLPFSSYSSFLSNLLPQLLLRFLMVKDLSLMMRWLRRLVYLFLRDLVPVEMWMGWRWFGWVMVWIASWRSHRRLFCLGWIWI